MESESRNQNAVNVQTVLICVTNLIFVCLQTDDNLSSTVIESMIGLIMIHTAENTLQELSDVIESVCRQEDEIANQNDNDFKGGVHISTTSNSRLKDDIQIIRFVTKDWQQANNNQLEEITEEQLTVLKQKVKLIQPKVLLEAKPNGGNLSSVQPTEDRLTIRSFADNQHLHSLDDNKSTKQLLKSNSCIWNHVWLDEFTVAVSRYNKVVRVFNSRTANEEFKSAAKLAWLVIDNGSSI